MWPLAPRIEALRTPWGMLLNVAVYSAVVVQHWHNYPQVLDTELGFSVTLPYTMVQ